MYNRTSPGNSLVLWRADLLHKNYGGDYTTAELGSASEPRLARLTQFITFMPKKYRTQTVLSRKAQAVLDGVCNNHWASLAFRVPITPFPAWSAASKAIPCIVPKFGDTDEEDSNGAAALIESEELAEKDEASEEQATKKRTRNTKTVKKKKKKDPLDSLPADIVSLL